MSTVIYVCRIEVTLFIEIVWTKFNIKTIDYLGDIINLDRNTSFIVLSNTHLFDQKLNNLQTIKKN